MDVLFKYIHSKELGLLYIKKNEQAVLLLFMLIRLASETLSELPSELDISANNTELHNMFDQGLFKITSSNLLSSKQKLNILLSKLFVKWEEPNILPLFDDNKTFFL